MPKETVNLYEELGVSNDRAHEIHTEIKEMVQGLDYLSEVLSVIPKSYDRESIIVGVFLAEMILENDSRLRPTAIVVATIPPELLGSDPNQN